jgi:ABC-type antimicrobial peptide transport system permease subunit
MMKGNFKRITMFDIKKVLKNILIIIITFFSITIFLRLLFILSSALVYVASIVANGLISSNIFFKIKPIIFRIDVIFYMFVLIIIVNLLSSIIPIIKLSKSKPIDVINNK